MRYTKIAISFNPYVAEVSEVFQALLGQNGFDVFEETQNGFDGYVQTSIWDELDKPNFIADSFDEVLSLMGEKFNHVTMSYDVENIEDQDWNSTWESESFSPINVDDKVYIHSPMYEPIAVETDVVVDPKLAFGSGHHETTCMMVRNMLMCNLHGARVADIGCGTGILALVAAKRGAESVVAVDIDEASVENTKHNAELNHVDCIHVCQGMAEGVVGEFDLVLANIMRNVLVHDMPDYARMVKLNGKLVVSGFYSVDAQYVIAEAEKFGFVRESQLCDNDWMSLVFVKK